MTTKVITDVGTELLTTAKAKAWGRISETTDDTLIGELITAVRQATENYIGRAIGEQTREVYFDELPKDRMLELPYPPHTSISSVKSVDYERTETELTVNEGYYYHGLTEYKIEITQSFLTGTLESSLKNAYKIQYVCGYTSSDVPEALLKAMARIVARNYQMRGDDLPGADVFILDGQDKLMLNPFRRIVWF